MIRILFWSLFGFVAGVVTGYIGMIVGYGVYTGIARVHDQDGGAAMTVGFVIAPAVGLFCGVLAAILCGPLAARTRKRN